MIFFTDIDRTLTHSKRFAKNTADMTCIEIYNGEPINYMSTKAVGFLNDLKKIINIVPVTTRSVAQYNRITITRGLSYAIVANGGIILKEGKPLSEWAELIGSHQQLMGEYTYQKMYQLISMLHMYIDKPFRLVDNLFYFAKIAPPYTAKDISSILNKILKGTEWTYAIQGIKVYVIPRYISKEAAVNFLYQKIAHKSEHKITAGDGKLDENLVKLGDIRFIPRDSELYNLLREQKPSQTDPFKRTTIIEQSPYGTEKMLETILEITTLPEEG